MGVSIALVLSNIGQYTASILNILIKDAETNFESGIIFSESNWFCEEGAGVSFQSLFSDNFLSNFNSALMSVLKFCGDSQYGVEPILIPLIGI